MGKEIIEKKLERAERKVEILERMLEEKTHELFLSGQACEEQNTFMSKILESIQTPFYVIDAADYTIKLANAAAYDRESTETGACYALTHKSGKPCREMGHSCPLEEVKRTKKPVTVEHIHYDSEGNPRQVEVHGYPVFDDKGNVIQMIEYNLDITERKSIEEALLQSEQRFRSIVDNIGIGVSLISPDMEILSLNKQMKEWFPEIEISKHPLCFKAFNVPPKDEICSYCPTEKTLKDGQVHESLIETPAGKEVRHYRVVSSPVKDAHGKVAGAIEMVDDITEQTREKRALEKSEESLSKAQNIAHIGSWEWDVLNNELSWSDEIYRIFGFEPHQVEPSYDAFLESVHPADRDFVSTSVDEVLIKKSPYSIDHRIILADGVEKIVHEEAEVFFDDNGNPTKMSGTTQDISGRKEIENELVSALAELSKKSDYMERFHKLTIDRELEMVKLKGEINKLLEELGRPKKYEALKTAGDKRA